MPLVVEHPGPWFGAAALLAVSTVAVEVADVPLPFLEHAILLLGTCASFAAWGLVSARSNRAVLATLGAERSRPAADELDRPSTAVGSTSYLEGMAAWTAAVLDLVEHALPLTPPGTAAHEAMVAAAEETSDLADLLAADGPFSLHDRATFHALGTIWEAGQHRVEVLAAGLDPHWHRRWRARTVVERQLRHGAERPDHLVLSYVAGGSPAGHERGGDGTRTHDFLLAKQVL